jgi:EAL domain-containing protein (putative c-di-GMP-specific phosphodiesterase class I)
VAQRSEAQRQVGGLLRTARESLGLSMAFLSRMDGTTQHLEVMDSSIPFIGRDGRTQVQETSLCQAIIDKKLPAVIPDLRKFPEAMALPAARLPRIRSYVSVPVVFSDGTVYGTFCAAGLTSDRELQKRDQALMTVLAQAAAAILEPEAREAAKRQEIHSRMTPVIESGGPTIVVQPIVDLQSGIRIGVEALSRFPSEWGIDPDVAFEQAHRIGVGATMELLALRRAVDYLDSLTGYVSLNMSAAVLLEPESIAFFSDLPLPRILLELSEHDPVDDYVALGRTLNPLREAGLKLAVDDAGAGFASLRHIVQTSPDVIKLDRSIVTGLSTDRVLETLVRSLVQFASDSGATTVAEGVETSDDAATLQRLGVDCGQGWYFGRPMPVDQLQI